MHNRSNRSNQRANLKTRPGLKQEQGIALLLAIFFMLILTLVSGAILLMSQTEIKRTDLDENYVVGLALAEAGAERAVWELKQNMSWQPECSADDPIKVEGGEFWIEVIQLVSPQATPLGTTTRVKIISTGRGGKEGMLEKGSGMRRIEVIAQITGGGGLSDVFDYMYFLNNWGWWYWGGGGEYENPNEWVRGEMRSNGRFDFDPVWWADTSRPPRVDDDVWAYKEVDMHSHPIRGVAGTETYQHSGLSKKGDMPNLQHPDFYRNLAKRENGKITGYNYDNGTVTTLIDKVYGDDEPHKNIVLIGTSQYPIVLNGPVYVEGNVVIKGTITGQGSIYAGRNIYVAGNITYKNPPVGTDNLTPAPFPSTTKNTLTPEDQEVKDWYERNKTKDVVAFAAAENIVLHNYTSSRWYADVCGLWDMGSEDVGRDGIPDTGDEGEDDGTWTQTTEDLDGDGNPDMANYSWKDITTSGGDNDGKDTDPLNNFGNKPSEAQNKYGNLCSPEGISKLEGIFYTQHAVAGRLQNTPSFNGSIISKDEVMVYSGGFKMNYDFRYHSSFRKDPNWPINLKLPPSAGGSWVDILSWKEVKL